MGSCATYRSTNRKQIPKTADEAKRIQTRGCVQGTFCPPISRAIKKLVMVTASVNVPGKSTRLIFRFSEPVPWPGKSFWGPSSFQTTKRMATSANGHWMRNDLGRDQYIIAIFPKKLEALTISNQSYHSNSHQLDHRNFFLLSMQHSQRFSMTRRRAEEQYLYRT